MSNEIFYHPYTLRSHKALNSKSAKQLHQGILIKVNGGVGCIHPWPVLGDAPLEEQLDQLRIGRKTPLIVRALKCAQVDAAARAEGVSLFSGLKVPRSHATINGGDDMLDQVKRAEKAGFDTVKIKVGRDLDNELKQVLQVSAETDLKIRLDFNCHLSGNDVEVFVSHLDTEAKAMIEFLEDPCEYSDGCWQGLRSLHGIRLAMDMGIEQAKGIFSYAVIKPAKNDVEAVMETTLSEGRKALVTSYMDHPVGQAYAAYCAGVAAQAYPGLMTTCGLMTHGMFETNPFIDELGAVSPEWTHASGTGLGFDKLLEALPWKTIGI